MATNEAMTLISMICLNYHVASTPGQTVESETSVTLPLRYGLNVAVTKRTASKTSDGFTVVEAAAVVG